MFSLEELAQSCGQEIGKSQSTEDHRRPLDAVKTHVLKGNLYLHDH